MLWANTYTGHVHIGQKSESGKSAMTVDATDVDQIVIDINAQQTTGDVVDITADSVTTAKVIDISADAMPLSFPHNDQAGDAINIEFDFPFYGQTYSELIVKKLIHHPFYPVTILLTTNLDR